MLCALALLTACGTTPLDVVYQARADAAAGGATADAGPCSVVTDGLYALRSRANGLCLGQGAPTTVFGFPGFLLDFAADCRLPARSWQLASVGAANVFSIQNQLSGFVLDVKMAAIRDGTPVITYSENGLDNQRFEVRARDAFASELRPQHHADSCVSASLDSAQIDACVATDATQAWLLQRSDCL